MLITLISKLYSWNCDHLAVALQQRVPPLSNTVLVYKSRYIFAWAPFVSRPSPIHCVISTASSHQTPAQETFLCMVDGCHWKHLHVIKLKVKFYSVKVKKAEPNRQIPVVLTGKTLRSFLQDYKICALSLLYRKRDQSQSRDQMIRFSEYRLKQ